MTERDDTPSDLTPERRPIRLDQINTIAIVLISLAALFVAWDQARSVKLQQAAAVLPIVKIEAQFSSTSDGNIFALRLRNVGIGPALISHIDFQVDGQKISEAEDFDNFLAERGMMDQIGRHFEPARARVIGAQDDHTVYSALWPTTPENNAAMNALIETYVSDQNADFHLTLCYCSVFDQCWVEDVRNVEHRPLSVETCSLANTTKAPGS